MYEAILEKTGIEMQSSRILGKHRPHCICTEHMTEPVSERDRTLARGILKRERTVRRIKVMAGKI
jgi:hypothetical protein